MYSLTICFGPVATTWAFLFKEKEYAFEAFNLANHARDHNVTVSLADDFGQTATVPGQVHGICLEDLDAIEAGRIQRSLAEERVKVKLMAAAKADPVISAAIRQQHSAPVITPMGGGFRG